MLCHRPDCGYTAETVRDVLVDLIGSLPEHLRGSLTWDQGAEMAGPQGVQAHDRCPRLLLRPLIALSARVERQHQRTPAAILPKGIDLTVHVPEDLELIAQKLNRRPRKTLGWKTPAERLLPFF